MHRRSSTLSLSLSLDVMLNRKFAIRTISKGLLILSSLIGGDIRFKVVSGALASGTVSLGKGIYCACEWGHGERGPWGLTLTVDPCRRKRLYVRYVTRVREEIYADQEL